ncbi:hypothetical protein PTTW11_03009 [Pyrenophora teres f. teres]|uniref:Uncharacterized protein n=1 Tax=Pyrenophora teres f. teres TaxID=97479 RepID=A0A6S6VTI4_9PLEO|nr:hypothetical protein PTTW11_03009 [Pyrenophora teres f. teres]
MLRSALHAFHRDQRPPWIHWEVLPRLEGRSRDCAAQAYPLCPAFNVVLPLLLVLLLIIVTAGCSKPG